MSSSQKELKWQKPDAIKLKSGLTLQQDGATAHTAKMAQAWCQINFAAFWLKEIWPPLSSDLNIIDLGICTIMEQTACIMSQTNEEVLKKKLADSWDQIEGETVRATCAQMIQSLRRIFRETTEIQNKL